MESCGRYIVLVMTFEGGLLISLSAFPVPLLPKPHYGGGAGRGN